MQQLSSSLSMKLRLGSNEVEVLGKLQEKRGMSKAEPLANASEPST